MIRCNFKLKFQSTPPVKAATNENLTVINKKNISIHAAREGGDVADGVPASFDDISIHAAREGGDASSSGCGSAWAYFNPRRP